MNDSLLDSKQLPNLLTLSRIAVIPLLVAVYFIPGPFWAMVAGLLFGYAAITDFLDGYVARRMKTQSRLGTFLDPIADKLLVATVLVLLVNSHRADAIPAIIILCREITVSGLREYLAPLNVSVPVTQLAKWKTGVQLGALSLLLFVPALPYPFVLQILGEVLLWAAAILTLVTGYSYLRAGLRHM